MKKVLFIVLSLIMVLSIGLYACDNTDNNDDNGQPNNQTQTTETGENNGAENNEENTENTENGENNGNDGENTETGENTENNGENSETGENTETGENNGAESGENTENNGENSENGGENSGDNGNTEIGNEDVAEPIRVGDFYYTLKADGTYSITLAEQQLNGTVTIPNEYDGKAVTEIGSKAFFGASKDLACVIVPASVVNIAADAFDYTSVQYVLYMGTSAESLNINDSTVISGKLYIYSEDKPTESGKFWVIYNDEECEWKKNSDNPVSLKEHTAPYTPIV